MLRHTGAFLVAVVVSVSACGTTGAGNDSNSTTTTFPQIENPEVVLVPDLIGMGLAEARSTLTDRGLDLEARPEVIDEAIVVAQEPVAGVQVAVGVVVIVDARVPSTCNAPDPLAPGPDEMVITVLFECGGDAVAPTRGIGVARIVPDSAVPVERIEWTLRSLLAGPTADEQRVGFASAFDSTTAGALNGVTLTDGALVVDLNDAIIVNNMNTATGMVFFHAELKRNLFLHPEVVTVELQLDGDCYAWSALFESDGCRVVSRADWEAELAAWEAERAESELPDGARDALMAYWDSLPSDPGIEHHISKAWKGLPPADPPGAPLEVWCVEAETSSADSAVDGSRAVWIVTRSAEDAGWSAALLASMSSTWPYEACGSSR
jgi:hypothetical protein